MRRFTFVSLLALIILTAGIIIPGCITVQVPSLNPTLPSGTAPVIVTFSSSPSSLSAGGTATLLWNTTGATSVTIDQGIGQVEAAGTRVVSPSASTVYILTATNYTGTVTRSALITVASAPSPTIPLAVTSVTANSDITTFSGDCPKTFTFYATITTNGPGTVTYRWERNDGRYSDMQSVTFFEAGTKTTTMQWELSQSGSGWHRVHILSPNETASNPVYYTLNCGSGSLVTGIVVGVDQFPFTGTCPKTINFWGTITANAPGTVTYRWERSDGATSATETLVFLAPGSQTVTNQWTRGEGSGWQRLRVLSPNDIVSTQINFVVTCYNQVQ